ncbi:MAG: NifB/NifX family molybdenum-iron cluster-binding protein [Candidatus Thermoplasmatota archaeon]|jgi:predicted Fe-Mo cluster-binding NifX family protein|nr:NifB/NifX family molybdenum-iron cluster-binding protein [Candidatus Thermoplasmatota archaeon]
MKIAVASDDERTISHHFGRAMGFVVFDIDTTEVKGRSYRQNKGKHSGECGSCDHATMIDNIKDCKYVICYGMGRRIYDDLMQARITPIVTEEELVDRALERFVSGALKNRPEKLHDHH